MSPLSRLWFALPTRGDGPVSASVHGLAQRPLAALLRASDEASLGLAALLAARGAPEPIVVPVPTLADLDRLAARHPGSELAVIGDQELLLAAMAHALGLPALTVARVLPRPGSLSAFHWPTGQDPAARVELIGLDLDWFPPWHAGQPRPRFPGGPGVAGSARR